VNARLNSRQDPVWIERRFEQSGRAELLGHLPGVIRTGDDQHRSVDQLGDL